MADTVNYCSWIAKSICISQSEWAAWTQALLTIVTFAVALWRQEILTKSAERKRDLTDKSHKDERQRLEKMKARAVAIAIQTDVTELLAITSALSRSDAKKVPKVAFETSSKALNIRLRAIESIELSDASDPVIKAVHGAQMIYNYLMVTSDQAKYTPGETEKIEDLAKTLHHIAKTASAALDALIYDN